MKNKKQEIFQKSNILKIKKFDAKNIAILFERVITKVIIVANKRGNLLNH
jgi:protein tyrosine/serine phosphatase